MLSHKVHKIEIPLGFSVKSDSERLFKPPYLQIVRGDTVKWINLDIETHTIISIIQDTPTDLIDTGPIPPNHKKSLELKTTSRSVNYICSIHPQERGCILISDKSIDDMTGPEHFKFLSASFHIKPGEIASHLDSEDRKAEELMVGDLNFEKERINQTF